MNFLGLFVKEGLTDQPFFDATKDLSLRFIFVLRYGKCVFSGVECMDKDKFMKDVERAYKAMDKNLEGIFMFHLLNFEFSYDQENKICTIKCPVSKIMLNPVGVVHGGIYTYIADTAMGRLNFYNKDVPYVSLELKTSFYKAISKGTIMAKARYIKEGYRVCFLEADICNEEGELLAKTSGTFYRFEKNN